MNELSEPLTDWLMDAIPQEAANLHRSYTLIPADDFHQQLWVTALRKRAGLEKLIEQQAYGKARRRIREGGYDLISEDDRYRRACKAARDGYNVLDEQFYSIAMIETLLPWYLDNGVTERPPQGYEINTGRKSNDGTSGDYLAMMLDIEFAMSKVRWYHRRLLDRYYSYPQGQRGWTHAEIASAMRIDADALRMRRNRALGAMRLVLGGRNPWRNREEAGKPASEAA